MALNFFSILGIETDFDHFNLETESIVKLSKFNKNEIEDKLQKSHLFLSWSYR